MFDKESEKVKNLFKGRHGNRDCLFVQVVYDGLFGANTNNKLLSLTLQFVHHICMV